MIYHVDCGDFLSFKALCGMMLKEWADSPFCPYLRYAQDMFNAHRVSNTLPPEAPLSLIRDYNLQPETAALILSRLLQPDDHEPRI